MQRERKRERREEKRKVPGRKKGFNYSARRNVLTRCTGNRLSSIYLPTINIKYYFELSACVPISFIGFVVLRLSLFSTRDDYLLQLTQNDLTHELTYKTFFLYFDISLRESYTLKRNLSTRRSFFSRHHLQRDHHSFESTCSDSEENYARMRPSFPGGNREEKSGSCIRYQRGTRSRFSRHSKPLLGGLRVVPWLLFFSFPFQPAPFPARPLDSTRETRIICGREPFERDKEQGRWTTVVLSTR